MSTLGTLAENVHTQRSVLFNPAAPGELIHRIIAEYAPGDDYQWQLDLRAAMHVNTLADTLDVIASEVKTFTPSELCSPMPVFDYQVEGYVPLRVLVAVMVHKHTTGATRGSLRRLFDETLLLTVDSEHRVEIGKCLMEVLWNNDATDPQAANVSSRLLRNTAGTTGRFL